jgi:succinate dehydrogenase/fumarate reductase flavoprotein subunit
MLFGGMMVTRGEAARLLRIGRSWDAIALGARLTTRFLADRLRYRRGTRLVLGNALAARLYRNLLDRQVAVWFETKTSRLVVDDGRVQGVVVEREGARVAVRARRGVVLAGGGFPASQALRERHLPRPAPQHTPAYEGCVGETLELALAAGAALGPPGEDNALWFPSSIATRADGTTAVYPHIVLDRAKPGLVAVDAAGRRFVDEAVSYHEFVVGMQHSHATVHTIPAWLVCDWNFVRTYGLGRVPPGPRSLRRYIKSGYLIEAPTPDALARRIGVDAGGLCDSVARNNRYAETGVDEDFGKGSTDFDRHNGDPNHTPNPCLGPIATPPYYAMAVYPSTLGSSIGLKTDADGRVLSVAGTPIGGLYACGNDMASIMRGHYPGPGITLGPGMVFAYRAAMALAKD